MDVIVGDHFPDNIPLVPPDKLSSVVECDGEKVTLIKWFNNDVTET